MLYHCWGRSDRGCRIYRLIVVKKGGKNMGGGGDGGGEGLISFRGGEGCSRTFSLPKPEVGGVRGGVKGGTGGNSRARFQSGMVHFFFTCSRF